MNLKKIKEEMDKVIHAPELWYSPDHDKIWMKDARGTFVGYRKGAVNSQLKYEFDMDKESTEPLFAKVYQEHVVDLVTKIGGRRQGLHEIGGMNVLVPSEQRRIEPVKGDWEVIRAYMVGMLGEEQFEWYKGWLQT